MTGSLTSLKLRGSGSAVPEPSALLCFGVGLVVVAYRQRH